MSWTTRLDHLHQQARRNRWLHLFAWFNRLALALGFGIAGAVKIMSERFASGLSDQHPMGHYLAALAQTGYYYPFIGWMQVLAAGLLLVPRTATLGALLYFPIILNICVLSYAVRFEGSLVSAPLMLLANLYLLCWDYDKLKPLWSPRPKAAATAGATGWVPAGWRFPVAFFAGGLGAVLLVGLAPSAFRVMPRNSFADCQKQFVGTRRTQAGARFCACIHRQGQPLDQSLDEYDRAPDDPNPLGSPSLGVR